MKGDILAYIHSNDEKNIERCTENINKNYIIKKDKYTPMPIIYGIVE